MIGKLIIVGTPIGNLQDFSQRAIDTLKSVDFIAAEDTRVTLKLLNHFNIKKPLTSYFEHSDKQKTEFICTRILNGETCALVSDAGMPAISDPGEKLVKLCEEKGISVTVIPGPSAFTAALCISGISSGRFTFEGFLSVNKKSRREHLNELKFEKRTMIFYEAPHKLKNTIHDLYGTLGDRKIAIIRELTKIHEEVIRTTLQGACNMLESTALKGEIVIIVEGFSKAEVTTVSKDEAVKTVDKFLNEKLSLSQATKLAAKETGLSKSELYRLFLNKN